MVDGVVNCQIDVTCCPDCLENFLAEAEGEILGRAVDAATIVPFYDGDVLGVAGDLGQTLFFAVFQDVLDSQT